MLRSAVLFGLIGPRLPILLLGAIAVTVVGTIPAPTAEALWRVASNERVNLQARRGTDVYYQIATVRRPRDPSLFLPHKVVFFPLFALFLRGGGGRLGGRPPL